MYLTILKINCNKNATEITELPKNDKNLINQLK